MRLLPLCLLLALATAAGAQPFETGVNQAWLGNAYGHDLTGSFDRDGWARDCRRGRTCFNLPLHRVSSPASPLSVSASALLRILFAARNGLHVCDVWRRHC